MSRRNSAWLVVLGSLLLPGASAWAADTPAVSAAPPPALRIIGTALRSTDLERSVAFYTKGLGMKLLARLNATEIIFSSGGGAGQPMLLLYKEADGAKSGATADDGNFGHIMLAVPDADAAAAQLKAAGYSAGEIQTNAAAKRRVFWATDPDGHRFEMVEMPGSKK